MNIAVCTLFEGAYHIGAAALANSLHAAGFNGTLWAGYRGDLPPWAKPEKKSPNGTHSHHNDHPHPVSAFSLQPSAFQHFPVGPGFDIAWIPLTTTDHLTNHKPAFLRRVFDELAPDAEAAIYLDPDIVVKCPWQPVFPHWVTGGIALVEDVNADMPARHPQRLAWANWLAVQNLPAPTRIPARYYNAGFIGIPRSLAGFLDTWQTIVDRSRAETADSRKLKNGDATHLFHSADQDALNIALSLTDAPLNTAGPDAMDFIPGGHHLSHAIGTPKPWQPGHFRRALSGYPPSTATKSFHEHTTHPIAIYTPAQLRSRKRALRFASLIGRFYRRA